MANEKKDGREVVGLAIGRCDHCDACKTLMCLNCQAYHSAEMGCGEGSFQRPACTAKWSRMKGFGCADCKGPLFIETDAHSGMQAGEVRCPRCDD